MDWIAILGGLIIGISVFLMLSKKKEKLTLTSEELLGLWSFLHHYKEWLSHKKISIFSFNDKAQRKEYVEIMSKLQNRLKKIIDSNGILNIYESEISFNEKEYTFISDSLQYAIEQLSGTVASSNIEKSNLNVIIMLNRKFNYNKEG